MTARLQHLGGPLLRGGVVQAISPVVVVDERWVFVAGLVPMRDGRPAADDISGQTDFVLDLLAQRLAEAGCSLADLVKTTVWLTDVADYPAFNAAYTARFAGLAPPARSTVVSALIAPVKLEIEAVAVRPS